EYFNGERLSRLSSIYPYQFKAVSGLAMLRTKGVEVHIPVRAWRFKSSQAGQNTAWSGHAVQLALDPQERPGACYRGSNEAGIPRDCAGQRSQGTDREDPGVQGHGALLRQGREPRALSITANKTKHHKKSVKVE